MEVLQKIEKQTFGKGPVTLGLTTTKDLLAITCDLRSLTIVRRSYDGRWQSAAVFSSRGWSFPGRKVFVLAQQPPYDRTGR